MPALELPVHRRDQTAAFVQREQRLQQLVGVYIATGLLFMLLPGTFLGVWNLLSISAQHTVDSLSPAWLQAHGHAQIFGWLGTFILGIGFYSLSKMGNLPAFAISRGWLCFGLWTAGVALRWVANVTAWEWRELLPLSALLELGGFLLFYLSVSRHRTSSTSGATRKKEAWMTVVIASTIGFLVTLLVEFRGGDLCFTPRKISGCPVNTRPTSPDASHVGIPGSHGLGLQCPLASDFPWASARAAAAVICGCCSGLGSGLS